MSGSQGGTTLKSLGDAGLDLVLEGKTTLVRELLGQFTKLDYGLQT